MRASIFRIVVSVLSILISLSLVGASTIKKPIFPKSNTTSANSSISNRVSLRIQPLGDSITFGFQSTDGNGFRLGLLNLLTAVGNPVQYIGSVRSGNMTDNFNEGHPEAVISEIASFANLSLPELPNLVLLMAGTNDCNDDLDLSTAPNRLGSMLDEITNAVPNATVLVAQLTPIANATSEANVEAFNAAIPKLVASRVAAGKKMLVVDMMEYVTTTDLFDGLHPNDGGYQKMAQAWFEGIQKAGDQGLIDPPTPTTVTSASSTLPATSAPSAKASSAGNGPRSNPSIVPPLVTMVLIGFLQNT